MLLYIIILALVQGITEFLPVSSSGHLVLLNSFFGIENDFLLLSIILHVATLFSVLFVLKKQVMEIVKKPFGEMGRKIIIATIPTVIFVLLFKPIIEESFNGAYLPICFMLTAVFIVISEFLNVKTKARNKTINKKTALFMGIAQGIAVLPGISRSGSTICAGLANGKDRKEVAHFSFLMSIPIIIASLILEVYEYISVGQTLTIGGLELIIGFLVAFLSGIFAVKFMIKLVEKSNLMYFAVYLAILSLISFFVVF